MRKKEVEMAIEEATTVGFLYLPEPTKPRDMRRLTEAWMAQCGRLRIPFVRAAWLYRTQGPKPGDPRDFLVEIFMAPCGRPIIRANRGMLAWFCFENGWQLLTPPKHDWRAIMIAGVPDNPYIVPHAMGLISKLAGPKRVRPGAATRLIEGIRNDINRALEQGRPALWHSAS